MTRLQSSPHARVVKESAKIELEPVLREATARYQPLLAAFHWPAHPGNLRVKAAEWCYIPVPIFPGALARAFASWL